MEENRGYPSSPNLVWNRPQEGASNFQRGRGNYDRGRENRSNMHPDNSLPIPHEGTGNRQNNPHGLSYNWRSRGNRGSSHGQYKYSHGRMRSSYSRYPRSSANFRSKNYSYRQTTPYSRPHSSRYPGHSSRDETVLIPVAKTQEASSALDPLQAKIQKLLNAIQAQDGVAGQLVFLQTGYESPAVILQNAMHCLKEGSLIIKLNETSRCFELYINEEKLAEGDFQNKQLAKNALCESVLEDLKKKCFYITKKRNYEEISSDDISNIKLETAPVNNMEGSKAHLMMLKMGWGGKGLGSQEQGEEKTVAETITKNITKAGLGEDKNVMNEIKRILEEFAGSNKVTTLAFDSGFTKDERAHIHQIAAVYNLKSKSEGKGDNRRITIAKKIAKWDLVRELLLLDCENASYKLTIPADFENFWRE